MLEIGSFFIKWKNRGLQEVNFRATIIDVMNEQFKFELFPSSITYSNNVIYLKVSPAVKSAILLKKMQLISKIQEKTSRKVVDIK